ncbi:hypothetical protein R80B4_01500 [Fibrobacteres bacterium R8-0-B4]
MPLEEAIIKAADYCIANDILKEFLLKRKKEVVGMLLTEWNWDTALAVREEEGFEKGVEKGMEKGIGIGREEGREESRVDTARRLLSLGVDVNIISQATELPVATIQKL